MLKANKITEKREQYLFATHFKHVFSEMKHPQVPSGTKIGEISPFSDCSYFLAET
jgi:hypothetical protein